MNSVTIAHFRLGQCWRSPRGSIWMLISLWLISMAASSNARAQENLKDASTYTSNKMAIGTNAQPREMPQTSNVPKAAALSQRLGGSVAEVLLKNKFTALENGAWRRERVTVGDLKKLFKYEDQDLNLLPSSPLFRSIYELPFADVRCIIEEVEQRKSIHDDATLVNVSISTNVMAGGLGGAPTEGSMHMGKYGKHYEPSTNK